MTSSAVYPLVRAELCDALDRGQALLAHEMAQDARHFRTGSVMIREGENHEFIYLLNTGWVARSRDLPDGDRQLIAIFLPNDMFGVKSLLLDRQPDTVVTLTDVTVGVLHRRTARRLLAEEPDVALRLMFQLGEDERRLHNWTVALGRPAVERLAFMLVDLRGRLKRLELLDDDSFRLPMTQEDIGDRIGLSVVHVNRILRELREKGLVEIDRGTVRILDPVGLKRLALPLLDVFEREEPAFDS